MMIIDMDIRHSSHSQFIWHVGEPFPVVSSQLDHVERVCLDGDELTLVAGLDSEADYTAKRFYVLQGDAAIRVVGILRLHCIRRGRY
jgi:hypothetical protein